MSGKLEIIVLNVADAIAAQIAGADRLELVTEISVGGLSPTLDLVVDVISAVEIPVNVMVRCQSTDFIYSREEINEMEAYVIALNQLPINGIVFGALTATGKVNIKLLKQFRKLASEKDFTFHRAIDENARYYHENCKQLAPYITSLLTSGGLLAAVENNLEYLRSAANHDFQLIIGGGVTRENFQQLCQEFPDADIHIGSNAYINRDYNYGIDIPAVKQMKTAMKVF